MTVQFGRIEDGSAIRVAHVITGLGAGGAELMLARLVARVDVDRFTTCVISLTGSGPAAQIIERAGVRVSSTEMRKSFSIVHAFVQLRNVLRDFRPDVIHTWMYHADLLGGLAARSLGETPVVWNVRIGHLDRRAHRATTILAMWTCARLSSRIPAAIVCGSSAALRNHAAQGYDRDRMVMIPNGYDTDTFRPDAESRAALRRELGLQPDDLVIGLAGRFDPQKDHRTFAEAAGLVARRLSGVRFVLCGEGVDRRNIQLIRWLEGAGVLHRCHLLGRREDMPVVQAGLDIAVSSSVAEGFPNAIAEAMSCGVPCVVTDVGDSADLVGCSGIVIPPRDHVALAEAVERLVTMPAERRRELGEAARDRILRQYGLEAIVARYEALWEHVAAHSVAGGERCAG